VQVVVSDHVFDNVEIERSLVAPLGATLVVAPSSDEDTLASLAASADAMLVCFAPITARVIKAAAGANCKIIARYGIGVDNVDVAAATDAGIRVTNVPDYCLDEVADHTVALLLSLARRIVEANQGVRSGGWDIPHGRVRRLRGRRLALIGVGRIGSRVVERALPFGLDVVGYDPFLREAIPGLTQVDSPEEAVAEADFVSLHAPLTPDTRHVVDQRLIDGMNRAPILINTSRGGLIDLEAAMNSVVAGKLSGLGLDVTEVEPLPADSPLRSDPRVVVTPHMAFYSVEATQELQQRAAEEVVRALSGQPPRCPVN
jgi:D-3-phosphoglycerate dehydrogenase / 2-oxoglutarate reductase